MSAIAFVGNFIDDWTKNKAAYRNILIAGDLDDRKIAKIVKDGNFKGVKVVSGASLKKPEDVGALIENIEGHHLIIIPRFEEIPETALDTLALILTQRKVHIQAGDPPRDIAMDLPHFSLICVIDPAFSVSHVLFEMFEIKLLVGHNVQISIATEETYDMSTSEFVSEITHSHDNSHEFMIVSYEMPIILRIDSFLNENPDWYRKIAFAPAEAPGGTHSVIVEGGNKDLAKIIFEKFRWIGQFVIKQGGKVLFGGI